MPRLVGGEIHFTEQECADLAWDLRKPIAKWKKAFPCPAEGIQLNRIGEIVSFFGEDSVVLVGGSVMRRNADLSQGTSDFMDEIRSYTNEQLSQPLVEPVSSCKIDAIDTLAGTVAVLKCSDFHWSDRGVSWYAVEEEANFRDVARHELIGRFGENAKFDLRYFEIGPGGYSSLEKNVHEHVFIGM